MKPAEKAKLVDRLEFKREMAESEERWSDAQKITNALVELRGPMHSHYRTEAAHQAIAARKARAAERREKKGVVPLV